jgi:hypothetical protein
MGQSWKYWRQRFVVKCQYFEFWYRWSNSPNDTPKVIESAITVTKELGMRYLWVDKYCIDQRNDVEEHDQISKMDTIYRGSAVTIISAAGDDENYCLPGTDNELRCCRPSIQVGSTTLVFMHGHPSHSITAAKWSSRAWTYQEAVLSRRRLVFTEEQVYFECESMNCFESLNSPLRALHTKTGKGFRGFGRPGVFAGRNENNCFGGTQSLRGKFF